MGSSLPVRVLWVSKCRYDNEMVDNHTHDFYHLFLMRKGNGYFFACGEHHPVMKNEVYLCRPGFVHGLSSTGPSPLDTMEAKFEVANERIADILESVQWKTKCQSRGVEAQLEQAVLEALYKPLLYKEVIETVLTRILLELARNDDNPLLRSPAIAERGEKHVPIGHPSLDKVTEFIYQSYAERITLRDLAAIASITPAYLNKVFKETYKVSPMRFVNDVRIAKAKELMMSSDLNITQIAEKVGFRSVHYFCRYFKNTEKISPKKFQTDVHENVYVYL